MGGVIHVCKFLFFSPKGTKISRQEQPFFPNYFTLFPIGSFFFPDIPEVPRYASYLCLSIQLLNP